MRFRERWKFINSIKEREEKEERGSVVSVMLRCRDYYLTDYLWGGGIF